MGMISVLIKKMCLLSVIDFSADLIASNVCVVFRYDMNTTLRHLFGNKEIFQHSFLLSQFVNTLDLMTHRTGLPPYNYLRLDDKLRRENIIE